MRLFRPLILISVIGLPGVVLHASTVTDAVAFIDIVNDSDLDRVNEMVSVDNIYGQETIVTDPVGNEIPSQVTYDGKLIFAVNMSPGSTARYAIVKGLRHDYPAAACGRFVPERDDDFAWENDLTVYRAYGPATCTKGGKAYGYDVWTKNVSYPIIDRRYHDHLHEGKSYHINHGDGMDAYAVGATLGGGTAALLGNDGKPVYNCCFDRYEILDNGPLRFTVRLIYPGEERLISLDAGSHFNHTVVRFSGNDDLSEACIGIVTHDDDVTRRIYDKSDSVAVIGYEDPTDSPCEENGKIYVGALLDDSSARTVFLPFPENQGQATGHCSIISTLPPDRTLEYRWGSGWSKGDVENLARWKEILMDEACRMQHPLKIKVTKSK